MCYHIFLRKKLTRKIMAHFVFGFFSVMHDDRNSIFDECETAASWRNGFSRCAKENVTLHKTFVRFYKFLCDVYHYHIRSMGHCRCISGGARQWFEVVCRRTVSATLVVVGRQKTLRFQPTGIYKYEYCTNAKYALHWKTNRQAAGFFCYHIN